MKAANRLTTLDDMGGWTADVTPNGQLGADLLASAEHPTDWRLSPEQSKFHEALGSPGFHKRGSIRYCRTHTHKVKEACDTLGISFETDSPGKKLNEANAYVVFTPTGKIKVKSLRSETGSIWRACDDNEESQYYCYLNVPAPQRPFEVYTLEHLLEGDFRVTYLIDGILVAGQPCIFAGPQKVCKTLMMLFMGLCLSMGHPFLGSKCTKSRVLFMSGESGMATLQEAARRMVAALGGKYDADGFHLSPDLPMLSRPLDELEKLLIELKTEVLIIDPAYLCMEGTEAGNMFVMGQQLRSLAQLCTQLGITPVIAHHTTKAASRENKPLDLTDIAWSGFGEFARQWVLLSRRESYVDGTGEHKLFMRVGGSAGHSNLLNLDISEGVNPNRHWQVDSVATAAAMASALESRLEEDCLRVLAALQDAGEPLCKTPLRDASGINSSRFDGVLTHLLDTAKVVEAGKKRGNSTYFTPKEQ